MKLTSLQRQKFALRQIIKELITVQSSKSRDFDLFPFMAGFQAAKSVRVVSSHSYSNTSISPSVDNFKTFTG